MPRIAFTANLRRHVTCPTVEASGATVRAALEQLFAANPRLRHYILDEQDRLRRHVNVYVNGAGIADRMRLSDQIAATDEIFVFQALSGG